MGMAGFVLGCGVWVRASWWPIALFLFGVAVVTPVLRRQSLWLALVFGLLAAPQVYRSSRARGSLALSSRATWHVALVGLGYYPNPYGLEEKDEAVFRLTREKYGVPFRMEDYAEPDRAAKQEVLSILSRDPGFVLRSFGARLGGSPLGTPPPTLPPHPSLPTPPSPPPP